MIKSTDMTLGGTILTWFAKDEAQPEIGATANYTLQNCLEFARRTLPDFDREVCGRIVLDYGCGPGWQSVAMAQECRAARVFGLDIVPTWIDHGTKLAASANFSDRVHFGTSVPDELRGRFDIVLSLSAFEHYADPAAELDKMRKQLATGGKILLSFAEPWWSHDGSHINMLTRIPFTNRPLPWINLLFSDAAMLELRSRFFSDHPEKIRDISGGLNKMTVKKFKTIIAESGMIVDSFNLFATKNVPLVTRAPLLRELFTSAASCVLRAP